jgi:three-Cys-motif partner protein
MPRGADDRFWQEQGLPSVFKHTLLDKYVPQFAGMTGSRSTAKRVVFLDGYAGRGRYDDGRPASAELVLRMAQNQGNKGTVAWTCFLVEVDDDDAALLTAVVDEYARQGVRATAHHGSVLDVLDDVVRTAIGCPLFVFLDPCGLGIPYDRLTALLRQERRTQWPPTEVLLNFSLEAVRRIAGHVGSERGSEATRARLDQTLGGNWWRSEFSDGGVTDQAVETVVRRFVSQLAHDTGMHILSVPVRRAPRQKPRATSASRCVPGVTQVSLPDGISVGDAPDRDACPKTPYNAGISGRHQAELRDATTTPLGAEQAPRA